MRKEPLTTALCKCEIKHSPSKKQTAPHQLYVIRCNSSVGNYHSPARKEKSLRRNSKKLRKNQTKLRKNQIISPKNFLFPRELFENSSVEIRGDTLFAVT